MLYILFSFFIITPTLLGFGELSQKYIGSLWEGISAKIISGILFLMIFWHLLAFFYPVNQYIELGNLAIGWGLFLYHQSYKDFKNFSKKDKLILGILTLMTALAGSGFPFILDHFGYYVPSIKWLSEFGLVKGISNLNWILGQMSPWHIFQAGFSHFSDPFLRLNSLLLVIFFLYILEQKIWLLLIPSPILFFFVQSPSPDLPSIIFSIIILCEILRKNQSFKLLFAFSMLVFSIKPTMIWLPILSFLYPIFIFNKNLKFIYLGVLIGVLYFIKNIWIFGYPLFPMNLFDFNIPWKPYYELFSKSKEIAISKTFDFQYSLQEISHFSTWEYLINWCTLKGIKGFINICFILSLFLFGIYTWIKKNKIITLIFISILAKSLFVIWFSGQYRFFIEVFFVIFIIISPQIWRKKSVLITFFIETILVISILFYPKILKENIPSFNIGFFMKKFRLKQLYKPSIYTFNQYKTYQLGNLTFHVPKNNTLSFDTNLPNITLTALEEFLSLGIFPQKIDKNLKKGFTWKYISIEEKHTLKTIIKEIKSQEKRNN